MAADTTTSRAPDARFLVSHPAHFIALGFGSGLAPWAPGTFGTFAGWILYLVLALVLPPVVIAFLAIPLFFLGVWACDVTARDMGVQDPGAIVWDEVVAFLPLAAISSAVWWLQLVAFALFRLFDIWTPYPSREIERRARGGFGVMIDDVFAAFYAYVAFAAIVVVAVKGFGYRG